MFFVKLIISICFIWASSSFQKLCIWNDTPNAIHNHDGADNAREKANIGPFSRIAVSYITGAAVPSDHSDTGTMNSVTGSGAPLKCGFVRTGEPAMSAPQVILSVTGT